MGSDAALRKPYFDRETTLVIKGWALIMMFIHHFWGFPERFITDVWELPDRVYDLMYIPNIFCVAIFSFVSGYAYFFSKDKSYKYSFSRIIKLLIPYWAVLLILGVIGAVFFGYKYTPLSILKEAFAIETKTVEFAWYVLFYMILMLVAPIYAKISSRNAVIDILITCYVVPFILLFISGHFEPSFLTATLFRLAVWSPMFFLGFIFAKHATFEKLDKMFRSGVPDSRRRLVIIFMFALLMPMENYLKKIELEPSMLYSALDWILSLFTAGLGMFCITYVCKNIPWKKAAFVLAAIGKESAIMWFLHSIFFNYEKSFFQPILYLPKVHILVIIWGLILCYFPALGIRKLIGLFMNKKEKANSGR